MSTDINDRFGEIELALTSMIQLGIVVAEDNDDNTWEAYCVAVRQMAERSKETLAQLSSDCVQMSEKLAALKKLEKVGA